MLSASDWVAFLRGRNEVTSTALGTAIYPIDQVPPNHDPPHLVVGQAGDLPVRDHSGHSGLDGQLLQIDLMAANKTQANDIWEALRGLDMYSGDVNGTHVETVFMDLPTDATENAIQGESFAPTRFTSEIRATYRTTVTPWT